MKSITVMENIRLLNQGYFFFRRLKYSSFLIFYSELFYPQNKNLPIFQIVQQNIN